ncbi:MAG: metallophosphoesterase [Planctomycetes bacterium]|nr:metallophosphoesterase [Planctomycetota bacterium]
MLTRRSLVKAGVAGVAAMPAVVRAAPAAEEPAPRPLRIAHLTDIHVQPERESAAGLASCFAHVQSLADRGAAAADLIVTGGDTIMDCMEADDARTKTQWDLWRKVKADACSLEVRSVVGNHDVWGWTKARAKTTGTEPLYGKKWACEQFGRALPYESFDRGGWHIVLLDSVYPHADGYIGRLDDAQWDWLDKDLAAVPATTPVILVSHIPILSVHPLASTTAAHPGTDGKPSFALSGGLVHVDHPRFQELFARRPNVKACLSGHLHVVERVEFGGMTYLCNGAVSAGWWKGLHRGTDFGYAVVDLHRDGTVDCRYVTYGWTAKG